VKYASLLGLKIEDKDMKKIKQYASELSKTSSSRLHEEINKILKTEKVAVVISELARANILKHLIPFLHEDINVRHRKQIIGYISKVDSLIENKKTEEYELYWGSFLYERLKEEKLDVLTQNYSVNIKAFFIKHLAPLKVPNKTCDYLGKVFHLFFRLQSLQSRKYVRKIKKYHFFDAAKSYLSVFEIKNEMAEFWTNIEKKGTSTPKERNKQKDKPKRNPHSPNLNGKKMIMTKNFVEKSE
jgi:tRNA nucleotidyltransferase/poly(A) polymerase